MKPRIVRMRKQERQWVKGQIADVLDRPCPPGHTVIKLRTGRVYVVLNDEIEPA